MNNEYPNDNYSLIVLSFLYIRYEKAVQKATNDLAALKYTEGSYEQSEENTRNLKVQVIIELVKSLTFSKHVKTCKSLNRRYISKVEILFRFKQSNRRLTTLNQDHLS